MIIRRATLDDGERLCEMAARFIETTPYGQLITWEPAALADLVAAVLADGIVFVAEFSRADPYAGNLVSWRSLVGMIALVAREHPLNGSRYGDELAWWVEPEHRGSSAAHRLLDAAEDWARDNRLSVLKMTAPAGSTIGKAYERRGFVLLELTYQKAL